MLSKWQKKKKINRNIKLNKDKWKDDDVGKTYLQYHTQKKTKITAGLHTGGLLGNFSTGPGGRVGCNAVYITITKGNRYGFNDVFFTAWKTNIWML